MSHSKCYRSTAALFESFELEVVKKVSFEGKWQVFCNINIQLYVMVSHSNGGVRYASLYIHSFPFLRPHFLAYVGIERTTYSAYEEDGRDYYPIDVLERLAELYQVGVGELLDKYTHYIWSMERAVLLNLKQPTVFRGRLF